MVSTYASRVFSTLTALAVSPSLSKKFPRSFPTTEQPPHNHDYSTFFTLSTYPTVNPFDGRVVSNFIVQALRGKDLTVYGDGSQTRSFQYIHDLVDGLIALMNSSETRPVNLGNGDEFTILEFASLVRDVVEDVQRADGIAAPRRVNIIHEGLPKDDPQKRRPDTSRAKASLEWQPRWTVRMGLEEMVRYYKAKMAEGSL
jgi:UDP-glucuronate decarboxylase